jgi:hypothetical protein
MMLSTDIAGTATLAIAATDVPATLVRCPAFGKGPVVILT